MKQNGVVCQPGAALLFFIFRFEYRYLISGPKSYRDFRETGPWSLSGKIDPKSRETFISLFVPDAKKQLGHSKKTISEQMKLFCPLN